MKPKVYLETTVPSYLSAKASRDLIVAAHQQITQEWWERRRNQFDVFISQFVLDEASQGDTEAAQGRLELLSDIEMLDITEDVSRLASAILAAKIIPPESATDAAHIALAAVHAMDFLLTWNCAHIANAAIALRVRRVCEARGFSCPVICTPEELLEE
jgi:hypothetical protein